MMAADKHTWRCSSKCLLVSRLLGCVIRCNTKASSAKDLLAQARVRASTKANSGSVDMCLACFVHYLSTCRHQREAPMHKQRYGHKLQHRTLSSSQGQVHEKE